MTATSSPVALVGMPSTGKSTYLAALYHVLSESLRGAAASLITQPAQRAYLQELRAAWLAGDPMGRTPPDNAEIIELHVAFGQQEVLLTVPDIAGETFSNVFLQREADAGVVDVVRNASGLLLFTHPEHVRPRVLISEAKQIATVLGEELTHEPQDFDPRTIPGEVHLVDLLQWILEVRDGRPQTRLGVIVSAWDLCSADNPRKWLNAKMPMLRQYLEGTPSGLTARVFGVCAQGGDYTLEHDVAQRRPYERAYVVDDDGERTDDLTVPLRWAALE